MIKHKLLVFLIAVLFVSACDNNSHPEVFEMSEYIIVSEETLDTLNIEYPEYVHSDNKNIADITIRKDDIIITSTGKGRTNVYIGDKIGLCNCAVIIIYVDGNGNINVEDINRYDGKAVNPNIKYAVTINGIVGNEIAQTRIDLQMDGTHFIVTENMDVTSWFINLPTGLKAKIFEIFATDPIRGPNEVYIQITGTPLSLSSEEIKITVPGANVGRNWDVYFNTRSDARYNIIE